MKTGKLLAGLMVAGFACGSQADSLLGSFLQLNADVSSPVTLTLNDDDQSNVILIDDPSRPTVTVPNPLGGTIEIPALVAGDSITGVVDFPAIDVSGNAIALSGFELTGVYSLTIDSIDVSAGTFFAASVSGSISIYEDAADNADFTSPGTGFDDGALLGSFTIGGPSNIFSSAADDGQVGATAAGLIAEGEPVPGAVVTLSGLFDGNGLFADSGIFSGISTSTFTFSLQGPADGFDFGSDGDLIIPGLTVIPAPATAGAGLIGLVGLVARRRRQA